ELRQSASAVAPMLGFGRAEWSEVDLRGINGVSKVLIETPPITASVLTATNWNETHERITDWIDRGKRRNMLRSELSARYFEFLLEFDLDDLNERLEKAKRSWLLPRFFGRLIAMRRLRRALRPEHRLYDADSALHDVQYAQELRGLENYFREQHELARALLGKFWGDGEPDWEQVTDLLSVADRLRQLSTRVAGSDEERARLLRTSWAELVQDRYYDLHADKPVGKELSKYVERAEAFAKAREKLVRLLRLDPKSAWGDATDPGYLDAVLTRIGIWKSHLEELRGWCYWRKIHREAVENYHLENLVKAYEDGQVSADEIEDTFDRSYYQWWVQREIKRDPVLRGFSRPEFELRVQQFRELDQKYLKLTQDEIRARLALHLSEVIGAAKYRAELSILRRERQKRRRFMPLRQLFSKIPNVLHRLKPCLLMSPLSVAQYLDPAHPQFDIVIFDEASQIPVWDAIGAIARGREVVLVGDPKQLPPTNFFNRSLEFDTVEEEEIEDLESILDECIAAGLPELYLRWHYRSLNESLITFSNCRYYENRLFTFPSPSHSEAVFLRLVNGVYDRSGTRTNRIEADEVVNEVVRRLRDAELSKYSIGIVTFNLMQQKLIEDLLDEKRQKYPEIDPYFYSESAPKGEAVFVKNLENVQGDERDVILFSICYGPDAQGYISRNFGPLNKDGGERRLNVAITRARHQLVVFSSMTADQIRLSQTSARGVADLKDFLDYAQRGMLAIPERPEYTREVNYRSALEREISEKLRELGYEVHCQVGCSGCRIDLAVVDPEYPERYLLGIEYDGDNYYRVKTARDRDRLRQLVLENLGWRIHRVWSIDWWRSPNAEVERVKEAIEQAKQLGCRIHQADATLVSAARPERLASIPESAVRPSEQPRGQVDRDEALLEYVPYKVQDILGDINDFYSSSADNAIREVIENVVIQEGPVSFGIVVRRVAAHWGITRVGSQVAERIKRIGMRANVRRVKSEGRLFFWPPNLDPDKYRIFRVSRNSDVRRSPKDIAPQEIANAALYVLRRHGSMPADDLIVETARVLGFARTGKDVASCIRAAIKILKKRGEAFESGGRGDLWSTNA
ncbi:MAG: DUF3320 domain-containing protein, partial [Armatimonadota bacterium]|nr:DUF3320 domain-containing protein [Armatimonadota bacterium]